MNSEHTLDFSWLADLQPLYAGNIDLIIEVEQQSDDLITFEYGLELVPRRVIALPTEDTLGRSWKQCLGAELRTCSWNTCLANLLSVPTRSLRSEVDGELFRDGAALLAEILKHAEPNKVVLAFTPAGLLLSEQASSMRLWLATAHRVEGIVHLSASTAEFVGIHPHFSLAILVIRSGPANESGTSLLRIADLRESPRAEWHQIIASAAKRGGGEVGSTIVLRSPHLDERPWTYERFATSYKAIREDTKQLGGLTTLDKFVDQIRVGFDPIASAKYVVQLDESGSIPEGAIPCFGGRSIARGGKLLSPAYAIKNEQVSDDLLLRAGDVLLRSILDIRSKESFVLAATVPEHALPASYDRSCIRIRWRADLQSDVAELLVRYLNSNHVKNWLVANGAQVRLNIATLKRLEVPDPSKELLDALAVLAEAEQQYRTWATEVAETRGGLFLARSVPEQLCLLFGRQRLEIERLRAARDAESLDYQIRNYYPHPLSLRWELISQAEQGKSKLGAVLDCAEHLLMLLAILAILQEQSSACTLKPVHAMLSSFSNGAAFHLDWGKCIALVRAGVGSASRNPSPLTLRFPELAILAESVSNQSSRWTAAERNLRNWRNKQAHLQRLPDIELNRMCGDFVEHLRCLLQTVGFLASLPLVHVADYKLNPITSERLADFDFLQGLSTIFRRMGRVVQSELPRGAVGFLDHLGDFISASPWLTMNSCPVCKRPEVFIFNRYERGRATYIAMESGHPQESEELGHSVATAANFLCGSREQ